MTLHGSCLCGGFSFDVDGEPEAVFHCYCSHCLKNAGGPGQTSAKYNKSQVTITKGSELRKEFVLKDTVSRFTKHKVFCNTCGCTLWTIPMRYSGAKLIVRSSLIEDGFNVLPPRAEFFSTAKPKFPMTMKSFDTMPGK